MFLEEEKEAIYLQRTNVFHRYYDLLSPLTCTTSIVWLTFITAYNIGKIRRMVNPPTVHCIPGNNLEWGNVVPDPNKTSKEEKKLKIDIVGVFMYALVLACPK